MHLIRSLLLLITLASVTKASVYKKPKVHHNLPLLHQNQDHLRTPSNIHAEDTANARIIGTSGGSLFVDELGRSRIFRGTNVVYKGFPYVPDIRPDAKPRWSFNQDDVDILKRHATNVIRLGVMWPGVEPERGQYNTTYLDIMTEIVRMCDEAGIYGVFSEKFCGEGVPSFAAQPRGGPVEYSFNFRHLKLTSFLKFGFPFPLTSRYPTDDNGIPSREDCEKKAHPLYHGTQAVSEAYQRLYDNYDGLRDSFIAYWQLVGKTFLPFKNILGYDLINEPWNGNVFKDPSLSNAMVANRKNLQPFYDIISAGISRDPNAIIFFEPVTTVQKTVGFDRAPGGPDFASKDVLAFHYYESVQKQFNIEETIGFRVEQAAQLGAGSFLGEFEMGWMEGGNIDNIVETSRAADLHFLSYTGWEYTDYIPITGTNNGIRDPKTGLVRPDMAKSTADRLAGVTEIRTNFGLHFPDGHSLDVSGGNGGKFVTAVKEEDGIIHILPQESGKESPSIGEEVTVVLAKL
ncbi:glycoside hydrolase [Rhizoclosmatium globosum]|uniref:Glycoside hydrolase n=1 Tax=Rhizoclosmatium globosum TaxID=329046 RepID=A0A1Y2BV30_9FUNG|nr:glycoside hydrolase [Rhizoclosmatium globosum]|eukprot:ORY38606.1 glycoside hydrolase [Rhizoclosmatium globosum]